MPFLLAQTTDTEQKFVKYVAQSGDGLFAVLRKYELDEESCNLQYFTKINDLHEDLSLIKDKVYNLPITVYSYNGISIRSTIGNENLELAVAIEKYNDKMHSQGLKHQSFKDNKELWVPHGLLNCSNLSTTMTTTTTNTGKNFPLFGAKYAQVQPIDNSLNNWVFYIVGGHGGPDPGAVAEIDGVTVSEDEYAYDISLRLSRKLIQYGATAYMITRDDNDGIRDDKILACDKDETCYPSQKIPLNQMQRLRQRSKAVNDLYGKYKKAGKKQMALCIHIDSRSNEKRVDMFFYHHTKSTTGKKYAEILHQTIKEKYDFYNPWRGYDGDVSARDLYMLRETHPVTVYLELGNIQNPKDQGRFTLVGNRQAVADWLADGMKKLP